MEIVRAIVAPLDSSLYGLDEASSAFFKSSTGIHDDDELKEHILKVQTQAYAVFPYPCIRSFGFTKLKISKMPAYKEVLGLGQERKGAILLDIGCCFGNDARKVVLDGFPIKQIIASDLRPEFWDLGHVLFRSSPESFQVPFVAGNILDPTFLSPLSGGVDSSTEVDLSNVKTLNDLRGRVSVIWAAALFHLFSEKDQRQLAHALGRLLSPESGSIIFGAHVGSFKNGSMADNLSGENPPMHCHDPDSWKALWVGGSTEGLDGAVFSPDSVRVDTTWTSMKSSTREGSYHLAWSVTRL